MPFRSVGPVQCWRPGIREAWRHRFLRNPGDELGPLLVSAILRTRGVELAAWSRAGKRLLAVGSVVQLARTGDVVWGAGLRNAALAAHLHPGVELRAVRGPLTADAIRSRLAVECRVFGDPGLLAPRLLGLPPREPSVVGSNPRVLFLSHFGDPRIPPPYVQHMRMTGTPLRIMQAIQAFDVVISSALHGLVLAEALGVPTVWLTGLGREPEFKFLDYYYGTQRSAPRSVTSFSGWEDAINPPPVFSSADLLEAFPFDCFGAARTAQAALH